MKNVIKSVKKQANDQYKTANTTNKAGGKAWKGSATSVVEQLAMTGTMGNSFYAKTDELVTDAVAVLEKVDAPSLAAAIVRGRNEGFVRTFNILGLVYLSKKDSKLFKEVFNEVIRTGNDMEDFISMCRSIRGMGRAIKTAMKNWIKTKTNPYYAQKYKKQIADAIRLVRYPCDKDPIFDYVLNHYNKDLSTGPAIEKYPQLRALADAKACIAEGKTKKAMKLIEEHRLNPDSIIGAGKLTPEIWDAIGESMPVMRFLKNVDKLDREGAFERKPDLYKRKLSVKSLKGAKVFPFRLYTAYNHISNIKVKNHLADVLDQYVQEYDWDIFNKGSWVIAPDISGSMTWEIFDSRMKPSVVAGMFTGFFYKGLKNSEVVPWGSRVQAYGRPRADSVLTHITEIANSRGGGTTMEAPVMHMINKRIMADNCLFITDSMEWGTGWLNAWKQYKRINPKAKAFLLRVDQHNTRPISDALAKELDVYQIYGWSDNVVSYIKYCLEK